MNLYSLTLDPVVQDKPLKTSKINRVHTGSHNLHSTVSKAYGAGWKNGSAPTRKRHLTRVLSRLRVMLAMVRGELKLAPTNAVDPFFKPTILTLLTPNSCSVSPGTTTPQTESRRVGLGSFDRTVQPNSAEPPSVTVTLLGSWSNVWPRCEKECAFVTPQVKQSPSTTRSYTWNIADTHC